MPSPAPMPPSEKQEKVQGPAADSSVHAAHCATTNTLMESLLHDARNPLNALSINLEVMTERMKRQSETLMPAYEKNLRVMREQIVRVDAILRAFADFIAPHSGQPGEVELSARVMKTLEVLGHECRKKRISVRPMVDADVVVKMRDSSAASFLALQAVFRAIGRSSEGQEIAVTLRKENGFAVLCVSDMNASNTEPSPDIVPALQRACEGQGGRVEVHGGECKVFLPLS